MDKEKIKPNEEAGTSGDGEPARVDSPLSMPPVYAVVDKKSIKKKTPPDEEVSCLKQHYRIPQVTSGVNERFPSGERSLRAFSMISETAGGRRASFVERVELINLSKMFLLDF